MMDGDSAVLQFELIVRSRRSARAFLADELSGAEIRAVLQDAQSAPSNSNTQPWVVHLVSGQAKDAVSAALLDAFEEGRDSPDFDNNYGSGVHSDRAKQHAAVHYGVRGIARSDREGRDDVMRANLRFYDAPHAALLFMPMLGDGVRAAGDIGMYAQNFLLSLTARGLHGIPQTIIGLYADTVRDVLDVPTDLQLLFAIGFGKADPTSPLKSLNLDKVPVEESVTFHDTPGGNM